MEDYLQNKCKYSLNSLQPHVYLFTRSTFDIKIDDGSPYAIYKGRTNPSTYIARSVTYNEITALDERYSFRKTLTVVFDGYNNDLYNISGIIGIETKDGAVFILNPEFDATVQYEYRLDNDDDRTTYTFTMQSNHPTIKTDYTHTTAQDCKSLGIYGSGDLYMIESNNASIDASGNPKVSVPMSKVEYNRDSLVFTERTSDGIYIQSLSFDINFNSYKASWPYDMIEFLYNQYAVEIERKGYDRILCGWQGENGMLPSYTIESTIRENEDDTITMTFTRKGMYPIVTVEADITEDSLTKWEFIEGVGDRSAMVCVGVGVSMYTLKREVNAFGIPTGRYMQHVNFDYSDWGIDLVEEEFTEYKSKQDPDCLYGGCWWMHNNMPSVVEFNYPYQRKVFTLQNACGFEIVSYPSWLQVSETYGAPEESLDITMTNTTYTASRGYMTVLDANGAAYTTRFIYDPTHIINNKNRNVTAMGQTLNFSLNVPIEDVQIYGMSDGITVNFIQPDIMEITIPKNTTGNQRNLIVSLRNTLNGQTDTATIVQDKIYTKRILNGYLCENGSKYERYQIYESYYEYGEYVKTEVYERGNLIETGSIDCTGYAEKWEDMGEYVCDGSNAYHAIMRYTSDDGGRTWKASGEIRLGDPWETHVSCNETGEELRLSDKWQCLPNDYVS